MNNLNTQAELQEEFELGQMAKELQQDPRFKKVIQEGYIINVLMQESQGMLDINPAFRQEALEKIQAVNYFRQYFTDIVNIADAAQQDIQAGVE